jgi:transcriptional regulator with GAF, ATPase, and Fis domain
VIPITPEPASALTPRDPELLGAFAVIERALEGEFLPSAFLRDLAAAVQPVVPHDRLALVYLDDDRQAFSVFAEHGSPLWLPDGDHYTTDSNHVARFPVVGPSLASALEGTGTRIPDLAAEPGPAPDPPLAGLRSAVLAPLRAGSRVVGAVLAASREPASYREDHLRRAEALGRLLGPFVEMMARLHQDVRRRQRLRRFPGITHALGTNLDVREILMPLGEAIRPALDFDDMGVVLLTLGSREFLAFGAVGSTPAGPAERLYLKDFSCAATLEAGHPVIIRDGARELDPRYAADRVALAGGLQSALMVPMSFGDELGGALFFAKREAHWYDALDAEIGMAVASQIVLGIQHQRLAEEQRRLASVERRARTLEQSLRTARTQLHERYDFEQILGRSPLLREALTRAAQVARTEATVLVTGESGTGKELVARAIHHASPRADGPFVAVNCAALPDTLLESELFGHERGAFTGADRQKPGRFELAAGGTLFLDEIGDLSAAVQAKLLRVLQEREFQRVGGTVTLKADVRLITATNRDLAAEIVAGRFRSDLFYRLSVFNVHLPPLRERGEDVLLLAGHFMRTFAAQMSKGDLTLSRDAREVLLQHAWPGNIRELQNAIERSLITSEGTLVTAAHLAIPPGPAAAALQPEAAPTPPPGSPGSLQDLERAAILEALQRTHGQKSRAATLLGITRFQLYKRLKRYQIEVSPD